MNRLVHFRAPDVRDQSIIQTEELVDPQRCWVLDHGVNYQGLCPNADCISHERGYTICQMGLGKFRPNEQLCYNQIICPECDSLFEPDCYIFLQCSAKINFCIGESADQISLSEDREDEARQLGQRGETVIYQMLVIEVERPGIFPDLDRLQILETQKLNRQDSQLSLLSLLSQASTAGSISSPLLSSEEMNPAQIHFIQDSIARKFQCGRSVRDTMEKLKRGVLRASSIPTISVFQWKGKWHTEDNRRLWCFKEAGLSSVPVKHICVSQVDTRKFSTTNNGLSVFMR